MKKIKYLSIVAALLVAVITAHAGAPLRGVDVKLGRNPGGIAARQHLTVNPDGTANIKLPGPGNYTVTYANGPNAGKVIWQGEVKKAQTVKVSGLQAQVSATN